MARPSKDEYFMRLAQVVASRSTCLRRKVGCVIVDSLSQILSTGYNGVARGQPHCNESRTILPGPGKEEIAVYPHSCRGALASSGSDIDNCEAVHGEQNALVQCRDVRAIETVYCTTCPCPSCFKLLLSTNCKRVVYLDEYVTSGQWKDIWIESGRTIYRLEGLTDEYQDAPH